MIIMFVRACHYQFKAPSYHHYPSWSSYFCLSKSYHSGDKHLKWSSVELCYFIFKFFHAQMEIRYDRKK